MEIDRRALEDRATELRVELKAWEKLFQDNHEGRKASRDDIKADLAISAKYKEYNKTRDILSGKVTSRKTPQKQKRVRHETKAQESPSKRGKIAHDTPQKGNVLVLPAAEEENISSTPVIKRTFIGPTPQKDGIVLGIFDLFPSETPTKPRTALAELQPNIAVTPSKSLSQVYDSPHQYEDKARGSRTPASSGKRFLLDSFVTPRKRKTEEHNTPSSSCKKLMTPAFLKRDQFAMDTIDEAPDSPKLAKPWARRSFGRSLSGMIQDMRKEQERQADDELDLLREMEEEEATKAEGKTPNTISAKQDPAPETVVEYSQAVIELDRDGFVPSDIEEESGKEEEAGDQPRKVWKKKGLKRQTRRVKMRPVAKKAHSQLLENASEDDEDDNTELVPETQAPEDLPAEDVSVDADADYDAKGQNPGSISRAPKNKKGHKPARSGTEKPKVTRKVKADAHANYRALKIKNKNSKSKGRGRFGRGR